GLLVFATTLARPAFAQTTTTYHLHKELSGTIKLLKPAIGPDASQTAFQTTNLKGSAGNFSSPITTFISPSGGTGLAGVIPANSTVSFSLYMKVTSLPSSGSIYPYVILTLNSAAGQLVCSRGQQDGAPALTTSLSQPVSFTCTTGSSAVPIATTDQFFLQVNVWVAGTVGTHNTFGELDIETNADSTVTVPNPVP